MFSLHLPPEVERRLNSIAKKSGRTKSQIAREAILRHINDLEENHLASLRVVRATKRVTLEELERKSTRTR
jgi:RHH-type transcriptional regulator, rel operon repressor / antitoxin RelB